MSRLKASSAQVPASELLCRQHTVGTGAHLGRSRAVLALLGRCLCGLAGLPPFAGALGSSFAGSVSHRALSPSEFGLILSRRPDVFASWFCSGLGCDDERASSRPLNLGLLDQVPAGPAQPP